MSRNEGLTPVTNVVGGILQGLGGCLAHKVQRKDHQKSRGYTWRLLPDATHLKRAHLHPLLAPWCLHAAALVKAEQATVEPAVGGEERGWREGVGGGEGAGRPPAPDPVLGLNKFVAKLPAHGWSSYTIVPDPEALSEKKFTLGSGVESV